MILKNDHLVVEAEERGAQLMRIYSPVYDHEYLWINDPSVWGWRSPHLFPVIGELKDGSYTCNGSRFEMPRHGIIRSARFTGEMSDTGMHFTKRYTDDTLRVYPFRFRIEVHYILAGKSLEVWYHIHNQDSEPMPFSVGAHPAFTAFPLEDHYLQFEHNETVSSQSLNSLGLRTDSTRSGIENGRIALNRDTFANDAFVFSGLRSGYCELRSSGSPRVIRLHFGQFPYLGIWSKPNAPFVCIEPWYGIADHADATGNILEKEGITVLPPESMLRIGYTMDFS